MVDKEEESKKAADILEAALNKDANKSESNSVSTIDSEIKNHETFLDGVQNTIEPPKEPVPVQKKPSILDDVKIQTNEDVGMKDRLKGATTGTNAQPAQDKEIISKKEADEAKAGIVVELVDVGFMLLCMLLTWDFSEANQKQFSLAEKRKTAIKDNLEKIYNSSNKKSDPKKTIIWLIVGSYAPLFIIALLSCISRIRDYFKKKKQTQFSNIQDVQIVSEVKPENKPVFPNVSNEQTNERKYEVAQNTNTFPRNVYGTNAQKVETRGRHRKDCVCEKCETKRRSK